MRRRPLGMRVQLAAAMVALAVLSVAVAGLLIHRAADREVADFGRRDLQQTANRLAVEAGIRYREAGAWTARVVSDLITPETAEDHVVVLRDATGGELPGSARNIQPDSRSAAVTVDGRRVGMVVVGHPGGGFLLVGGPAGQRLDAQLTGELDQRLLESAVVAAAVALLLGLLVAFRVTAPLERVTAVARRMVHGEIETRELAQTLDRLAAALRRQDELRRATGADVAHELRNAMVGVMGRLEALQDGVVQDEQATIARALRDARRVHRLVDDVVLLSEAQRPSVLVRTQPVGFDEIVSEQTAAHVDDFADRGIELTGSLTPALVDGDPGRLTQIVENLLSNAHRYTDPGGRVDVRLEIRREYAVLQVADTGIGIDPEMLGRVFDRFWRAPEARERVAEGSGVGLALVRDLVLAQEGRVDVQSRPGHGSTFSVSIPLAATDEEGDGDRTHAGGADERTRDGLDAVRA